jgi:hypothetical protein
MVVTVFAVGFASSVNYTNHAPLVPTLMAHFTLTKRLRAFSPQGRSAIRA